MNRRFLVALLVVCFAPLALSQNAPPPATQSEGATTPQSKGLIKRPPEAPGSRDASGKKIGRITLDVTVTDPAGKPVAGLTPSDFTLLDNHQPAKIASFRSVDGAAAASDPVQVILLIDGMNNSFQSVAAERDQITQFLSRDNGQLPVPMSIALLSDTGLKINQPTQDGNILIAELKRMPVPVNTINLAMGGEGAIERFQLSLKILTQLLSYEGTRPGRKLLLWIGPGWPMLAGIHFGSSPGDQHSNWGSIVSLSADLRETRTTLYAVDLLTSTNSTAHNVYYQNFLKPVTNAKDADSGNLALPVLAVQSGGRVLNGSNDLAGEIASCIEDARTYYTFTLPVFLSDTVDEYHSLEVHVGKAGLAARTNAGFYNQPYAGRSLPEPQVAASVPPTTLRTEVRLVVTDVVVLDRHGSPVQGLKAGDFQLKEDGVPQKIASFEEHGPEGNNPEASNSSASPAETPDPTVAATPDGTISASNKPLNSPAVWNVLLVDMFNTPSQDLDSVRKQVQQFVKQLPADQPVALVAMSSQIKVLTSFQDGAAAVSRFLDKNGFGPPSTSTPADIQENQEELEMNANPEMLANKARVDVESQANRAQTTLDNFSAIAKWLNNYPGRKNVYWLSSGFPLQGQPFGVLGYTQTTPTGPAPTSGQTIPMQENTDKELESARVAIYPIDVRGVAAPEIAGETTADTAGDFLTIDQYGPYGDKSINVTKDDQLNAARQTEMRDIARATGGVARFSNNIARSLQEDFNQGKSYYTISYTPSNTAWHGVYRRINLALEQIPQQQGDQLIYRQGYYAKDPPPQPAPTADQFKMAMQHGAPAATSVLFSAKVNKSANSADVEFAIEAKTVQYQPDASGKLVADIDCAILEYNAAGKPIATSLIRLTSGVSPEQQAALNNGIVRARQTIALKSGATSLVLGVRDQSTGNFGNLEVPLATH